LNFEQEKSLLEKMGLDCDVLDSGCCGMAGAFGYEKDHYDVSIQCGERVLLPAVRQASHDSLIVTDGFSCREQILQQTDRRALHIAQVMQMALHEGPDGPTHKLPEDRYVQIETTPAVPRGLLIGAGVVAAAGLWVAMRHRRQTTLLDHEEG
jgi:hypothetical protein